MFWRKKDNKAAAVQRVCKMPSLCGIDFPLVNRLIVRLLVPETNISRKTKLYRTIFVRLIDKAIREYNLAREAYINDIVEEKQQFRFIEFTDHIETCINAAARLSKLLTRIKNEKGSPVFPEELRKGINKVSIENIRNAIEHMDEMIRYDKITQGNPIAISYNNNRDGIKIGNDELSFQELITVLKNMNIIAQYILKIKRV